MALAEYYLDYNATAPMRPETVAAVAEALAAGGNPSSMHQHGQRARARVDAARRRVADMFDVLPHQIVFTSGATEANNLAMLGGGARRLISAIEHPSVAASDETCPRIPVDATGTVRLDALETLLIEHRPDLVAVMAANNETGVIQPLGEIARLVHARGARLLVDAVQAAGKMSVPLGSAGADMITLSAHKLGGPQGVGALILGEDQPLAPRQRGGGQEGRRRAGTENVAGVVGFAHSLGCAVDWGEVAALRDRLEAGARASCPDALIVGEAAPRLPTTSCLLTPGLGNEAQMMALDLANVRVGVGAACSSGRVESSAVLRAMGLSDELARCAIRLSLGWASVAADVEAFLATYARLVARRGAGSALLNRPTLTT
jgi:cysteine desulfurase